MPEKKEPTFPLQLTEAQRRVIAKLVPDLGPQLRLDCVNGRTLRLTLEELRGIAKACRAAKASTGMERNSLRHVTDAVEEAVTFARAFAHRQGGLSFMTHRLAHNVRRPTAHVIRSHLPPSHSPRPRLRASQLLQQSDSFRPSPENLLRFHRCLKVCHRCMPVA